MPSDQTQKAFYAAIDEHKRIYNRRLCFIPEGVSVPGHPCVGQNRVLDFDGFFMTSEIFAYIEETGLQPQTVAFSDIWHQIHYPGEKEQGTREDDPRFRQADTAFPGILAAIRNPENKPYRMLDGRRRMWKLENTGATEGLFHVIPVPEVYRFFWMAMPQSALRQMLP
jgi:hypothetical protein